MQLLKQKKGSHNITGICDLNRLDVALGKMLMALMH